MKRQMLVPTLVAGALLTWSASAARADSLTGEVVDLACYLHDPNEHGAAHRKCAEVCVKKGMPIGLLTSDKQVYLLLEDHDNQKPYAALKDKATETVTVEGEKVSQGGLQGLVVEVLK
jgi:hypothetical protein